MNRYPCVGQCRFAGVRAISLAGALILAGTVIAFADFQDGPYTYTVTNDQAAITGFSNSYSGTLTITNMLGGYPVTRIGTLAFGGCNSLTNVMMSDGVADVMDWAVAYCPALVSVTIPAGVTNIANGAFSSCTSLQRAYFAGDPPAVYSSIFNGSSATVYYLPGTVGWTNTLAGRPAVLWNPFFTGLNVSATNGVAFTITGTTNIPVGVEARTNMIAGVWMCLKTTNLTDGAIEYRDYSSSNYPARYYRLFGP